MPKLFSLRILGAAILLILAYFIYKKRKLEVFETRLNIFTGIYAFWLILATIFSSAFFVSLLGVEGRFIGLITFLNLLLIFIVSLHFFGRKEYAAGFMHAAALTGILTATIGIFQYIYASFANVLSYTPFFNGKVPVWVWISEEKWLDILPKLDAGEIDSYRISVVLFYAMILIGVIFVYSFYHAFEGRKRKISATILTGLIYVVALILAYNSSLAQWSQSPQFRIFSTIGQGNHLGGFLAASLMFTLGLFLISNKNATKTIFALGGLLNLVAIILTASRGSLLGIFVPLVVIAVVSIYKHRRGFRLILRKVLFSALIALISLIMLTGLFWSGLKTLPIVYRTSETLNFILAGNIPDRLSWWMSSFEMIGDHPFLGIGPETFRNNYNIYRRLDYKLPTGEQYGITPESTHSEFINVLVTQGLPGLLFYLIMVFGSLGLILKAAIKEEDKIKTVILFSFAASALAYIGQTFISFGVISTLSYFYLALGVGAAVALESLRRNKSELPVSRRGLATAALILSALLLLWFGFIQYLAHYYYTRGIESEYRGKGNDALENYNLSINALPLNYSAYEKRGDIFLMTSGKQPGLAIINDFLDNAIKNYESSLYYGPGMPHIQGNIAQAYSKMAQIYVLSGNKKEEDDALKKAKEAAEKAIVMGKNNPILSYTFGDILVDHRLFSEAVVAYLLAYEIDPFFRQVAFELALSYYEFGDYAQSRKYLNEAFTKEPENLDLFRLDTDLRKLGF